MTASVSSVRLDYFYGSEVKTGTFFRVPKVFETNEVYRALSLEVKYLYSLMLDRVSISARNGWLDEGRVFIYFTLDEVKKCIRAGKNKAMQALHDMETLGLIQRKKQGQGKPARIFLKNIIEEKAELSNAEDTSGNVPDVCAETIDCAEPAGSAVTVDDIPTQILDNTAKDCGQAMDAAVSAAVIISEPSNAQDEKWDTPAPVSDSVMNGMTPVRNCEAPLLADHMESVPAFGDKCAREGLNEAVQTAPAGTSRSPEIGSQDFPKQASNYNNKNNTDSNYINLSMI